MNDLLKYPSQHFLHILNPFQLSRNSVLPLGTIQSLQIRNHIWHGYWFVMEKGLQLKTGRMKRLLEDQQRQEVVDGNSEGKKENQDDKQ